MLGATEASGAGVLPPLPAAVGGVVAPAAPAPLAPLAPVTGSGAVIVPAALPPAEGAIDGAPWPAVADCAAFAGRAALQPAEQAASTMDTIANARDNNGLAQ
jgi:hypothetical protein